MLKVSVYLLTIWTVKQNGSSPTWRRCRFKQCSGYLGRLARLQETCLVVSESIPSFVEDMLQMRFGKVEVVRRASIVEVLLGDHECSGTPYNTGSSEIQSQVV